jgi:hypothetical protein
MSGKQSNPSSSIMAGIAPNVTNPGAAMQPPAGLMGQNVGVQQKPVPGPGRGMDPKMVALIRRMQG